MRVRISPRHCSERWSRGARGLAAPACPRPSAEHPDWIEGSFRFLSYDDALAELVALAPEVEVLLPVQLRAAMGELGRRITALHEG